MRDQEDGSALAPQAVEGHRGLLPFERVLAGERLAEQHHRLGARAFHGAGGGQFDAGREAQQPPFTGAVLSDHSDDDAIGHAGFEIPQRRRGHTAKCEGHKR